MRNNWEDKELGTKVQEAALIADTAKREAAYKDITETVTSQRPIHRSLPTHRTVRSARQPQGFRMEAQWLG